jgi:copper homeostasis protein
MSSILIEVACASVTDCVEAEAAGAGRLELCSALVVGGLTPSVGLFAAARARTRVPIVCMVRPRAGAFSYDEGDFDAMRRDVEAFRTAGASGVVFGVLTGDGSVDVERCRDLVARAGGMETVFHRAFDVVGDADAALDALVAVGVTRVLTSGGAPTSLAGASVIRRAIVRSAGRLEVLPGGGVRADSVVELVAATGARAVHLGPQTARVDASGAANPSISFAAPGVAADRYPSLDAAAVRAVRDTLRQAQPPPI